MVKEIVKRYKWAGCKDMAIIFNVFITVADSIVILRRCILISQKKHTLAKHVIVITTGWGDI
ncbi:hypothetical protein nublan003_26050 [Klebsiella pneumoniae]